MSYFINPLAISTPAVRSLAIAALLGATFLATPLTAARADSANAPMQLAQAAPSPTHAASATKMKRETVEQRITSLHTALKISPDEESKWNNVAQAMRDNEAAMQKLVADRTTVAPQGMTAVDDLAAYQGFAQAHVDGLKNLTASFSTLYDAMPDSQKKVADHVFSSFGHPMAQARS